MLGLLPPAASRDHSRTLEVYDALPKFSLGRERESTKNLLEWNNVAIGNNRVVRVTMSAAILKTSALPGDPDGEVQARVIFPGVREELVDKALERWLSNAKLNPAKASTSSATASSLSISHCFSFVLSSARSDMTSTPNNCARPLPCSKVAAIASKASIRI